MNEQTRYVAANLTDLHAEPSWQAELLTQVTNGVALQILEERGEWCRVRQLDGYEGWAYAPYLTAIAPDAPTHIVTSPVIDISVAADGPLVGRLLAGTRVRVIDEQHGWARVQPAGAMIRSGWTAIEHLLPLASLPMSSAMSRDLVIAYARRFTGVYYLWGGCSAWGIDCSGLVQLVHRLCGHEIPRDARLQFPAGRTVDPPYRAGDLLYFHSEKDKSKITHVGLSLGGWRMIHSSRTNNGVYEDDIEHAQKWRDQLAGARRFLGMQKPMQPQRRRGAETDAEENQR